MRLSTAVILALLVAGTTVAQQPLITSFARDGTITWTNISTNGVAIVEEFSPATSGMWTEVYTELRTSVVSQAQLALTNAEAWFRVVNATGSNGPAGMVLIPGGSNSGTNPLALGESATACWYPASYSLTVGSYYMDRYEVTNDEMVDVMQWAHDNGRVSATSATVSNLVGNQQELLDLDSAYCRITWNGSSFGMKSAKGSAYPCVEVSWYGAAAYCNYRSDMEGRTRCYDLSDWSCNFSANGYRLPTDEEWEYAARGGAVSKRFPWGGDTISHSQANYFAENWSTYDLSSGGFHPSYDSGGYPYTSPVGAFAANSYGLYDMAGNVWEWCNDRDPCYLGGNRVVRGCGWYLYADFCRVGYRDFYGPGNSNFSLGFRAVLPPGP